MQIKILGKGEITKIVNAAMKKQLVITEKHLNTLFSELQGLLERIKALEVELYQIRK